MDDQSANVPYPFGPSPAVPWSAERNELHNWFKVNAPLLADPYVGAVKLLGDPTFPARIHLIAHLLRDICDRLPHFLGSVHRKKATYDKELRRLRNIWPDPISPSMRDYAEAPPDGKDDPGLQIPREAARLVAVMLEKHEDGRQTFRRMAGEMFALIGEATEMDRNSLKPIVDLFVDTHRWFEKRAHLREKPMEPPNEEELVRRFDQFEGIVLSLVRGFFKTAGEIDDLLQEANDKSD